MSATGRGAVREKDDYYTTPSFGVRRFLEAWQPRPGKLVEPSAGNGAIIRAAAAAPCAIETSRWHAMEIRDEERETLSALCPTTICDFLTVDTTPDYRVSAGIGNPPFKHAMAFIEVFRRRYPAAELALLLRLAFLASADRAPFMRKHAPDVYVSPDRFSFDGVGADSADYAWFVFPPEGVIRSVATNRVLDVTPLAERQLDKGHSVMIEPAQLGLAL
jgi:hypothetical protein